MSEARRRAAETPWKRDEPDASPEAAEQPARAGVPAARQVVALQRFAGNRAVSQALQRREPAPGRGPAPAGELSGVGDPAAVLDQSVISGELAEVTAINGVAAAKSASGRNLLVPEQPPQPPPPRPDPRSLREPAAPRLAQPAPAAQRGRHREEITAALTTAGAKKAKSAQPARPRKAPAPTAGQGPATGQGADGAPAQLVGAPAPDLLRGQVPQGPPPVEAIEEELAAGRSTAENQALTRQELGVLRAETEQHRTAVRTDAAAQVKAVRGRGAAGRATVAARLASATADLTRRAGAARTALQSAATERKTAIRADVEADATAAQQATDDKVAEVTAALADKRRALNQAADDERTGALAFADSEAARAVDQLEAAAVDCEQAGERQAARYPGGEDPAPEQRQAARQVARESAADIRAKKPGIRPELRAKATEHGQRCTEYASTVVRQLDEAQTALVNQLRATGTQAVTAIRGGLEGALAAVDSRLTADLEAVDATASATRQQLTEAAATTTRDLDTATTTAAGELDTAAKGLDREIDHAATETETVVSEPEHPFLPGVREQVTAARTGIHTTATTGRQHLVAAADGAEARFTAAAQAFTTATGPAIEAAGARFEQITAGFTAAADRARTSRTEAGATILTGLREQQQRLADGVLAEADRACTDARAELSRMNGQYRQTVTDAANRAVEEGSRPKTDDVNTRAHEAAEQVDEGWLAGLGRAIVKIAVGLVVLVVVALVVAAIAAAFGVLLTAWTAIMIAGAILLAASLVFALINRLNQAELSGRPGTAILVALADTVGITGIYEGIAGKDIVTSRPLSAADRTERGVLGAVTLVSLVLGARSAIKGPPGGVFTRPVGSVPGWAGLGALGRALAGARGVAGEIATAIGNGVRSAREWLATRRSTPDPAPGPTPDPAPDPNAPATRSTERVPGLYESIDPNQPPPGWEFTDTVTEHGTTRSVTTRVKAPDGSTGDMGRSYDTSTGEFSMEYAFLDGIPKPMRMVPTAPEMLPGKGTPLETYMTMRQMRILERAGATFTGPRTVHMSTIVNQRTILELARLESQGVPLNEAILRTHSVQYANNSIVQSGGRIAGARVSGGSAVPAGRRYTPQQLAEYGIDPGQDVRFGFDIDLDVVPATTPAGPPQPGGLPAPVVPVGPSDGGQED